mmetsp:Transcript_397/g.1292  ORF Transcript_397/g.1292 Transcript_397/m.1292 type:complete len:255 (-) Transcript_397:37-801(-)
MSQHRTTREPARPNELNRRAIRPKEPRTTRAQNEPHITQALRCGAAGARAGERLRRARAAVRPAAEDGARRAVDGAHHGLALRLLRPLAAVQGQDGGRDEPAPGIRAQARPRSHGRGLWAHRRAVHPPFGEVVPPRAPDGPHSQRSGTELRGQGANSRLLRRRRGPQLLHQEGRQVQAGRLVGRGLLRRRRGGRVVGQLPGEGAEQRQISDGRVRRVHHAVRPLRQRRRHALQAHDQAGVRADVLRLALRVDCF